MRYSVSDERIREEMVHVDSVFKKELELAKSFVEGAQELKNLGGIDHCPLSGHGERTAFFTKWGLTYARCPETWNLSLARMPDPDLVKSYYFSSDLALFRKSEEYQSVVGMARTEIWEHQREWVEGRIQRYLNTNRVALADWGSRLNGWLGTLSRSSYVAQFSVLNPLVDHSFDNSLNGQKVQVMTMIDTFQRCISPKVMIEEVRSQLETGGLLIMACRSGAGFDTLSLAGESRSIFPLDHILLPSPKGISSFLEKSGFEVLEVTSPGVLDVEIVKSQLTGISDQQAFTKYMFSQCDNRVLEDFQQFLQKNNLSSHLRVVARKVS